jgi:hypothetical protein
MNRSDNEPNVARREQELSTALGVTQVQDAAKLFRGSAVINKEEVDALATEENTINTKNPSSLRSKKPCSKCKSDGKSKPKQKSKPKRSEKDVGSELILADALATEENIDTKKPSSSQQPHSERKSDKEPLSPLRRRDNGNDTRRYDYKSSSSDSLVDEKPGAFAVMDGTQQVEENTVDIESQASTTADAVASSDPVSMFQDMSALVEAELAPNIEEAVEEVMRRVQQERNEDVQEAEVIRKVKI